MAEHSTPKKTESASPVSTNQTTFTGPEAEAYAPISGATVQRATLNLRRVRPQEILQLQRTVGNRALADMLPARTDKPVIQAKLMVGPANDRYEQEADQVAEQVMRMPTAKPGKSRRDERVSGMGAKIQRLTTLQRAGIAGDGGFETDANFQQNLNATKGRGRALPSSAQSFMEDRFQRRFDNVRVHTGHDAVQLSRDIQAKAFTHGNHIYFNSGAYAPGTDGGKQLLAHELTHVVQQTGSLQRKSEGVIQRAGLFAKLKAKFSKKKPEDSGGKSGAESGGKSGAKDDNQIKADDMRDDAIAYEKSLGRYAFNHPRAKSAAKTVMDKMTGVLIQDFDESNVEHQKQLAATYGRDKADSAGQVGSSVKAVLGVLQEGNLRERMTALMNAMFGPFKTYVQDLFNRSAWTEAQDKGLNVTKLKRRKRQKRWNIGARDVFRDPGNPLDRKNLSTYQRTGNTRTAAKGFSDRTVGELDDDGIGLSEREMALQFPGQTPDDIEDEKLKWQEGGTYWAVNHKNKWVKKVENSLHMPVIAGPSGTMLRMFQTWEFLNKPVSAADWRLAVMAWMLTANDHSFHEMMLTASDYGLPYTPGHLAYMNVDPISLMELRNSVAVGGMFPHEHALNRQIKSGQVKHLLKEDDVDDGDSTVNNMTRDEKGALSGIGAAAIELYTRHGYLTLNPARKGGMFASKKIERNLKTKDEMDDLRGSYESGDLSVKDLISEAKAIIPVLDSALETLPDWSGDLYRGTGTFSPFSYGRGSKIRFGAYTSSTLDKDTAKTFADDFNIGPFKYILHLKTTAGKDVREISAANEDEILIPPGSEFTVKDRKSPKSGRRYYKIYMEQTKRGGSGLKLKPDEDIMLPKEETTVEEVLSDTPVFVPTLTEMNLYDVDENKLDVLHSSSDITDKDSGSAAVGNDGNTFWVEIGTKDGLYWVKAEDLEGFTGFVHPQYQLHKAKSSPPPSSSDSTPVVDVPSVSSDVSTVPVTDKKPLMLYVDGGGKMDPIYSIDSADKIDDKDVSSFTDDDDIKWTEILGPEGQFYWVKHDELQTFLS